MNAAQELTGKIQISGEAFANIAEENERLRRALEMTEKQLKLAQSARDAWKGTAELRAKKLLEVHGLYLDRITKLEEHCNRIANYVQGLPTRQEYQQLRDDHDNLSYRVPV